MTDEPRRMTGRKVIEILEEIANANLEWVGMQHRGDDGIIFDDAGRSLIGVQDSGFDEKHLQFAIDAGLVKRGENKSWIIYLTPTGWRRLKAFRDLWHDH